MPCPFCDYMVLVPDALAGLLIHPAPAVENKGYTPIPQREVIYPGCLIEAVRTVCMTILRGTELIMLFKMNDHFATLQTFALFLADGSFFYTDNIKIIKNSGWKHQTYQLLKDRKR